MVLDVIDDSQLSVTAILRPSLLTTSTADRATVLASARHRSTTTSNGSVDALTFVVGASGAIIDLRLYLVVSSGSLDMASTLSSSSLHRLTSRWCVRHNSSARELILMHEN